MRSLLVAAAVALPAAAAHAQPEPVAVAELVADVDAGRAGQVIEALRGRASRPDQVLARCALGFAYAGPAKKPNLAQRARALHYLDACDGAQLDAALAERAETMHRVLLARARAAGDSRVEIVTKPAGMHVEIDKLRGDVFAAPATVWLPAGTYQFSAKLDDGSRLEREVTLAGGASAPVIFEQPNAPRRRVEPGRADFEAEPDVMHAGAPEKHKHGSLLGKRYRDGLAANAAARERADAMPAGPRGLRRTLGVYAGAGVIDSAAGDPSGSVAVAIALRQPIAPQLAFEGRLDAGQRGARDVATWTVGAAAEGRVYPFAAGGLTGLALGAGLRVEVRTSDSIGGMTVERIGLAAAATAAYELLDHRVVVALRGEHGLTELVPGARSRALLLELGWNAF